MLIAQKEFVLNYATNRWGLNKKSNVGPTSDSIRLCAPNSMEEWLITIIPMLDHMSILTRSDVVYMKR